MEKRKFWPLDFDPEGEIYDTVAWDLPGYRRQRRRNPQLQKCASKTRHPAAVENTQPR
jgi:hypothetical protein